MQKLILGALLLFSGHAFSQEDIYAYNYWGYTIIKSYTAEMEAAVVAKQSSFEKKPASQCLPVYKNAIQNRVFDIRYALGYFDDSQGTDIMWDNRNYGISPSLDIGVFNSIIHVLTENCESRSQMDLCGFSLSGDPAYGKVILEKTITLLGNSVSAKITLTQASASESFENNKNLLADRQKFLTQQSEENYFGGIGKADVVIYNGHSRKGGGPDFNPPVLNSILHVNYDGYYLVKKPGITRVLNLIKTNPNKDGVLAFFSCFSKKHFYDDILKANPKQRLVLSAETIDYFDSMKASMGYLEGLLQGTCGQDLADLAKQGDKIKNGFLGFQIK